MNGSAPSTSPAANADSGTQSKQPAADQSSSSAQPPVTSDQLSSPERSTPQVDRPAQRPAETERATVPTPERDASKRQTPQVSGGPARGKFMDVVHPSSQMSASPESSRQRMTRPDRSPTSTGASILDAPSARPSRTGTTIAPAASSSVTSAVSTPSQKPSSTPQPYIRPEVSMSNAEPTSTTPEVVKQNDSTPLDPVAPQPLDDAPVSSSNTSQAALTDSLQSEPAPSPFLTDAKVDKRPLSTPPSQVPDTEEAAGNDVPPAADLSAELPAELDKSIMDVESSNTAKTDTSEATAPEGATASTPAPVASTTPTPSASSHGAIAQQYTKSSDDTTSEHAALYDSVVASSPAKKPKGWLVPVIAIVLIALGIAGGVAVYFMMNG